MDLQNIKVINDLNPKIVRYDDEYKDICRSFNSGKYAFNHYIQKEALENKKSGDGVTYLIIDENKNDKIKLIAYFSISASNVYFKDEYDYEDDEIPEDKKRKHFSPISSFIINMFAVNKAYQHSMFKEQMVSNMILRLILYTLYKMSTEIIGAKMIILCSVKDAVNFYKRNGFKDFTKSLTILDHSDAIDNVPMYFPIHNIDMKINQ